MTEQYLKKLGFVFDNQYEHDQFTTRRYSKGALQVEFNYEGDRLINHDLTISEVNCMPITLEQIKLILFLSDWG